MIVNLICDPVGRYLNSYYMDLEGSDLEDAIKRFIVEFNSRPDNRLKASITDIVREGGDKFEPSCGYPQFELCFRNRKSRRKRFEYWCEM